MKVDASVVVIYVLRGIPLSMLSVKDKVDIVLITFTVLKRR